MEIVRQAVGIALLLVAAACASLPDENDESRPEILLRSDVPLWMEDGSEDVSPRAFQTADSFGCVSELVFGDWRQTDTPDEEGNSGDPIWWRVHNYGVFHCAAVFSSASERGSEPDDGYEFGFFIDLGADKATGLNLFAWEIGLRTGSTYLLLAAPAGPERKRFTVLASDCSAGEMRKSGFASSWITEYCAIPSQAALKATARAAARRRPRGTLEFVEPGTLEPAAPN